MLNEKEIRALIVMRIKAGSASCNSYHINHTEGQIRGLVAALTGEPPPRVDYLPDILDEAGIPYVINDDGRFSWNKNWLEDHGFILDPEDEGSLEHPKFGDW